MVKWLLSLITLLVVVYMTHRVVDTYFYYLSHSFWTMFLLVIPSASMLTWFYFYSVNVVEAISTQRTHIRERTEAQEGSLSITEDSTGAITALTDRTQIYQYVENLLETDIVSEQSVDDTYVLYSKSFPDIRVSYDPTPYGEFVAYRCLRSRLLDHLIICYM